MSRLSVASADKVNSTTEQLMKEFTQRIVANPPGVCPVDMQLAFLKVCHAQTCGKCVPCRVGLGQLERLLEKVLDNEATMETLELIEETAENIKNSADCAIGFESARMVLAGLEGFREDYISHITDHRCLGSFEQPIPCVTLCPAHVDIPGYIALAGEGRCEDAVRLIRKDNPFPTACALICEHPCEARCRRNIIDDSINIRGMKRYIVDNAPSDKVPVPACAPSTGKKVAIIGGGPSGLTSAYFLQLMGHQCTVFEEKKQLGGMLRYGIPNYRFPRERLQEDINAILSTGVDVKLNTTIGTEELKQIQQEYDAFNIILGLNAVILVAAGFMFGWDKALYSILFQFASTQVLHTLYKKYQQETFFIVTNHGEQVYQAISKATNHGATILDGEGPYEHTERQVVYSVVSSAESKKVRKVVKEADPNAFINVVKTERLFGHFYYKPND